MSLIKWTPLFNPFEEMDRNLSELAPLMRDNEGFVPAIDMYEQADAFIVEAQLAGIDPEQVSIAIDDGVLSIKGTSEKKSEVDEKNYYRKEIRRGSFYRSLPLPAQVLGDEAKAEAKGGVLTISIPKAKKAEPKQIKINKA
jgi:HSP20 family protein